METLTPKDTIASGNEVLARFLGWEKYGNGYKCPNIYPIENSTSAGWTTFTHTSFEFNTRFDWLMPVWYKFRDLKFEDTATFEDRLVLRKYLYLTDKIREAILEGPTPLEAFKELVSGITWYNSIKS